MDNLVLLNQLENILGKSTETGKGNYSFFCPFCKHHKKKLEININTNNKGENPYHCWICDKKGKKLFSLLKKLNLSPSQTEMFNLFIIKNNNIKAVDKVTKIQLPENFISLSKKLNSNDITSNQALKYLYSRKITNNDILKYNIGYCENGEFANMIIIPSYDENMELNYFTGRSFLGNRKKNPSVSKNIIGLEYLINFNLPIILCEGIFDAISIKRNVIPLFGKTIQPKLKEKLLNNKTDKIYLLLDKDAFKHSLNQTKELMDYGKEVYLVKLDTDEDPSDLGFEKITKILQKTKPITLETLMLYKMEI